MTAPKGDIYTPDPSAAVAKSDENIKQFLERHRQAIVSAAANQVSPDRLLKVALMACTKQPKLMDPKMDRLTVLRAIMEAASLGLEIGAALGEAWLVPYFNSQRKVLECQMQIGYRGLVNLARRSGSIAGVDARPVFEGEQFEPHFGTDPKIIHVPRFDIERTYENFRAVYVVWHLAPSIGGGVQFDIMSKPEIDAIRKRSKSGDNGPWVTDYIEMAKKTVTKRGAKLVPMSIELADAIEEDSRREFGDLDIGTIADEALPDGAEVKAVGAGDVLRQRVGKVKGDPASIILLRAKQQTGEAMTELEQDELRQYEEDHPT